jgi:hypothetical protein
MTSVLQSHRRIWEQLPWILNGSASESEVRLVQEHLQQCVDCREALAFERRLREALSQPAQSAAGDPEEGWQQLSARIDRSDSSPSAVRSRPVGMHTRWLAAAVIVEALALGALVVSGSFGHAEHTAPGVYRTLASPDAARASASIRVVLAPEMTLDQFRVLLNGAHLQVVAGPGESGVWSLAPAADAELVATDAALRELRQSPQVRFAEPINGSIHPQAP